MAKKPQKRQFDWMTYTKPARLLTEDQEASLHDGLLTPLRLLVAETPALRLDIRARSLSLYYRGASLLRLTGEPFVAEIELAEGGAPERLPLETEAQVEALLGRISLERERVDGDAASMGAAAARREVLQQLASANEGADLFASEYVVVDLEYTYGKRRYDLVALKRLEGVTGPGGFAHPQLAFVDVRCCGQPLGGGNGLDAVGGDLADFVKATGGTHLARAQAEIAELVAQKTRLGLLPETIELREMREGLPELLVAFVGYGDLGERSNDAAIVALHERLASRHFPTEQRLRFVDLPGADTAQSGDALLIREEDPMTYRQLKEYRTSGRG